MISKLLKNDYTFNLANKLYTIVIGLLTTVFLTRYLGIEYRGDYSYVIQIASILVLIFNFGLHQSYPYYYRKSKEEVFNQYINIYIFQFLIHIILGILLSLLFNNKLYILVLALVPFNVTYQQMESTMAVENIRLKIKIHMLNATLRLFAYAIMYFFMETTLVYPIILTIVINIITISIYVYISKPVINIFKINFKFMKEIFSFSWVPMLTALLITLNYSLDVILLKNMGTTIELSLYSVALGVINYFWLIPDSFKEVLVSRVAKDDKIESILLSIKVSILSVFVIIIGFVLFGKLAIQILYGNEFSEAYNIIVILSFGVISMVYYKIIGVVLLSEGKRWSYFFILLISVITNAIANFITIPIYGMYGSAYSSVISYTICGGLFLIYFMKQKKLSFSDIFIINSEEIKKIMNMVIK